MDWSLEEKNWKYDAYLLFWGEEAVSAIFLYIQHYRSSFFFILVRMSSFGKMEISLLLPVLYSLPNSQVAILSLQKGFVPDRRRLLYCVNYGNLWEAFFENTIQTTEWFYFGLQKHLQIFHWEEHLVKTVMVLGSVTETKQRLVEFRRQVPMNKVLPS